MNDTGQPHKPAVPLREYALAWTSDIVASLYFLSLFGMHWCALPTSAAFAALQEGLGATLPRPTRVVLAHGPWVYPALAATFVLVVVGKELVMRDKRLSIMITFFMALVAQFITHTVVMVHYLPMFDLIIGKQGRP